MDLTTSAAAAAASSIAAQSLPSISNPPPPLLVQIFSAIWGILGGIVIYPGLFLLLGMGILLSIVLAVHCGQWILGRPALKTDDMVGWIFAGVLGYFLLLIAYASYGDSHPPVGVGLWPMMLMETSMTVLVFEAIGLAVVLVIRMVNVAGRSGGQWEEKKSPV